MLFGKTSVSDFVLFVPICYENRKTQRRQRIRIYDDPPLRNSDLSLGPFLNFGLVRFDMLRVIFSSPHLH